jgi:glycosyltransferase involved in cell wall biosynthesis
MELGKGPDLAITVARELGLPLTLAGPVVDDAYYAQRIVPQLDEQIRHVGVVNHRQKDELYGRAACVVLPFRHEEGFGMVTVEAMACGTPVVALANGAAGEIVEDGLTGYTTKDETALGNLVGRAMGLDRAAVRQRVAERFGLSVVARKYVELYERMLAEAPGRGRHGVSLAV